MRIQHNIMAMNAYRNYNTNTSALSKNLEKLSSGYKINRAGDDAAGLAISEKMRAQITGLNAAQKNVKDGISLVKTAEGAMQEIQDMLNRMAYLATQSANGTYDSAVDRTNLQKEVNALRSEINRIADSANFNGINLLDGTQAGTAAQEAQTVKLPGVSYTGMDRILKDLLGAKENSWDYNVGKTVLDSYVPQATKASFTLSLNNLKLSGTAKADASGVGSYTGAKLGTIKINIGDQTITIAASKLSGSIKITASGTVTGSISATALAQAIVSTVGSKGIEIGGVKWTATVNGSQVTFTQKNNPATVEEGRANFNVTIEYDEGNASLVNIKLTGDTNPGVINVKAGLPEGGSRGASTVFELKQADFVDGAKITFGDGKEYILKIGTDSKVTGTTNVLDLTALGDNFNLNQALTELGNQIHKALGGDTFTTTVNGVSVTMQIGVNEKGISLIRTDTIASAGKVAFKELKDLADLFNYTYEGGTRTTPKVEASGGLVLQIGDTSKSYNQMQVVIGDMHVDAMGFDLDASGNITTNGQSISDINIATAESAQDAIDVIKNAINYVSGIRGDLGAVQNRLEHTANNLSVMAENIQDAESTIRDTDIAEEMMAYTKNNILIQSAQAMLAQANAVPQGVLQLLG